MVDNKNTSLKPQNVILENCERMVLSGIKEVISFDEEAISLDTDLGRLEIRGNCMLMQSFDTNIGDMIIEGYIYAVVYTKSNQQKSFIKRVFK